MKKLLTISKIGAMVTIVAGALHVGVEAVEHRTMIPHLMLFLFGGGAQLWLGWKWFQGKEIPLGLVAVNGGFALLWLGTRFFLPPFLTSPESMSAMGWLMFILEIGALIALEKRLKHCAIAVLIALAAYGAGMVGQVMPGWVANHAHGGHQH